MAFSREAPWQGAFLFASRMISLGSDITADFDVELLRAAGEDLEMI